MAKKRIRDVGDRNEVAHAERESSIVSDYVSHMIFSLSGTGMVRQAMSFRGANDDYTSGSTWNAKWVGMTVEQFREKYEALGFTVTEHDGPKRINYEKNVNVVREVAPPLRDDLELQVQVLTRKLEGESFEAIGENLAIPIKEIHRAYRKATK